MANLKTRKSAVTVERLRDMQNTLVGYMNAKRELDQRILENERWYKAQHWDMVKGTGKDDIPEPVTAFLFNALANKHADAMDNYPEPNILEREEGDAGEAQSLSEIIPLELDINNFRQVYSRAWWYKLKNGTAAYGVFYNPKRQDGLGDIDIQRLDILNLFWEPGIEDIQRSKYFYIVNMVENNDILCKYPHADGGLGSEGILRAYSRDNNVDYSSKSLVVDCYYKLLTPDGNSLLQLTKFTGDTVLDSTEDNEYTLQAGLYDHGLYPVVFDVLYPNDGSPIGFGLIDIAKSPQAYIDRMDYIISKNAMAAGKLRWMIRDNGGINEEELLDYSKDVIHVAGSLREENIREFQARPLDSYVINHRQSKIAELKEIIGNRDFTQGGASGGVTAYGAIVALQEAGNKLSRDMISESYEAYRQVIYMCIELVRQFFDEERSLRISGKNGEAKYVKYSNANIKPSNKYKAPIFDIVVQPAKSNPFSRIAQNQMALDLFKMGFFRPETAKEALSALEMMSFEGKDKISRLLQKTE